MNSGGYHTDQTRRTVTAVALASGALGSRHVSVFHRFFARAVWSLDAVGRVLFGLALAWVPADQPLDVLVDDTLARKDGKRIALPGQPVRIVVVRDPSGRRRGGPTTRGRSRAPRAAPAAAARARRPAPAPRRRASAPSRS